MIHSKENEFLSSLVVHGKYAKHVSSENRRENWEEVVSRYVNMMKGKYPHSSQEIDDKSSLIFEKKILPSMRALQFAGEAIQKNESRIYNCAYLPVDSHHAFSETMFLLLGGTGVGYSVQYHHVMNLPHIGKPIHKQKYLVGDSIEGWADAVKALIKAYMDPMISTLPTFDFSDIRSKGSELVTAGGKAPGPEPLMTCLIEIEKILISRISEKLTPLNCHDILCHIANAVLAGGIRRAAMIALFSPDDEEMITCKSGNWWEENEQRGRANNSAVLERNIPESKAREKFYKLWKAIEESGSGEPGIYWTNDKDLGTNPCCEISLLPFQFCNLTEINASSINDQGELNLRAEAASFFGTLQAGFTDLHYLRRVWVENTKKQSLIGVGITGIGSGTLQDLDLTQAAIRVKETNERVAASIGINSAARCTTVKPSGTTSLVLGTSSGIHGWHADYYLRRMRLGKDESVAIYLKENHPELIEQDLMKENQYVVSIPQKAPESCILRTESPIDLLERVKRFYTEWVREGHRYGGNTNNVSATVSVKKDEWEKVGDWMFKNRDFFNGLSVLPYDGGTYTQAPFEDITKEQFEEYLKSIPEHFDISQVKEFENNVNFNQEAACANGGCDI